MFNTDNNEITSENIPIGTCLPISKEIFLNDEASYAKVLINSENPSVVSLQSNSSLDIKIHR